MDPHPYGLTELWHLLAGGTLREDAAALETAAIVCLVTWLRSGTLHLREAVIVIAATTACVIQAGPDRFVAASVLGVIAGVTGRTLTHAVRRRRRATTHEDTRP